MFWHMNNTEFKDDLFLINDFLLSIFDFAQKIPNDEFDMEEWRHFKEKDVEWFIEIYLQAPNVQQAIDKLFQLPIEKRKKIYKFLEHDVNFYNKKKYEYWFKEIDLEIYEKNIIKDFYSYFLTNTMRNKSGFNIAGLINYNFNKDVLSKLFYKGAGYENVCPICLTNIHAAKNGLEIEHYFPKDMFSGLILHPYNIYYCCNACNRPKSNKLPPKNARDIRKVFLPYYDTVRDKIIIEFENKEGRDVVKFRIKEPSEKFITEKIKSFRLFFNLEERWSSSLEKCRNEIVFICLDKNFDNMEELEKVLNDYIVARKKFINKYPDKYLMMHYLDYIKRNQLKAMYADLSHKGRETPLK